MAQQTINTPRETTHQRIADALEDIVDKIVDTSKADNVDYDNTESDLTADKVQSAIDELASEKADITDVNNKVDKYKTITTVTDLNTILESGFYSIPDGCTNIPAMQGGGKATLIVVAHPYGASSGRILQILVNQLNANTTDKMYYRIGTIGTQTASFLDWNRVLNLDDNDTITSDISDLQEQTQELLPSLTFMSRERRNITSDLGRLSTAVSEQNLAKYGYKTGDYFTGASGYTYILADYNTFKGTSTPYCITSNHLGIVVDTHATSQWHSGDASNVGYNGSVLNTFLKGTVLDNIKADFKALFGGSTGLEHLIAHSKLFTTALANWAWQSNQYISALTCTQIDAGSQWTANGFQEGEASKSLELFRKYKWTEIFGNEYPWLRNISNYSGGSFACAADNYGSLHGNRSVTDSHFVVGLIIFY